MVDRDVVIPQLGDVIANERVPLPLRFRALFVLRTLNGPAAIDAIARSFASDSELLKHECAYCLGQMQDPHAVPLLIDVLDNTKQQVMVRHEAAEALGAIAAPNVLDVLRKYEHDETVEVAETCQIAIQRVEWVMAQKAEAAGAPDPLFSSVDPAPPCEKAVDSEDAAPLETSTLREHLLDTSRPLFERYRAMFALRNRNSEESVLALVAGFHDKSALFRHEIAYVLGQMQHPVSAEGLQRALEEDTNPMVRHECAEALGSVATETCLPVLQRFAGDAERVVKESCDVALDMHAYESSGVFESLAESIESIVAAAQKALSA